jgi:peptide/nickel transport system permease protein
VIIAIAVALIPQVARLSRSHSLSIKEEDFVIAARTIGAQPLSVIFKHILPHTFGPIVAYAAGYVSVAIVAESALSFLGLGVPPPYPSLGGMLQEGRLYIEVAPWITIFPGIILSVSALSFALLGDALRDIFDPRDRFYNDSFFPWINRSNRKKM